MALVPKVSVESTQITFGSLASSLMAMVLLDCLAEGSMSFSTAIRRKIPLTIQKEACEGKCLEWK